LIYPDFLQKNDKIGVTAPSDGNSKETDFIRLDSGKEKLKALGYPVLETASVRKSEKGRSADGKTRAKELMSLVENKEVKAVISAKGGDFLCEILPFLDFEKIKENPKWYQGFSDNTGLVFPITTKCDIATIYGNNFNDFGMSEWHEAVINNFEILKGNLIEQHSFAYYEDGFYDRETGLEGYREDKKVEWQISGKASEVMVKGRLLGGCLDVLLDLLGTPYEDVAGFQKRYGKDGILWYLESFALGSEAMTRALWHLKEAGWFETASGFLFGRPCMFHSDTDTTYEESVCAVLEELKKPVIFQADIGHKPPQFTMINGALATLSVKDGKGRLQCKF
jgi:muramoyltetrapeptide carboxypeptidase LdcA involved in peptidoglycan recycling